MPVTAIMKPKINNIPIIIISLYPEFTYNTSGMLTSDLDKGISKITYNDIGLTDSICFANGTCINYFYSMTGEKLRVQKSFTLLPIYTGGTTTNNTHEFYDNIYYGSDAVVNRYSQIATFFFGDGYVDIKITGSSTWPVTQSYYYAKDHLGNIRSVVTKDSQGIISEVQKTHYYPLEASSPTSVPAGMCRTDYITERNSTLQIVFGGTIMVHVSMTAQLHASPHQTLWRRMIIILTTMHTAETIPLSE